MQWIKNMRIANRTSALLSMVLVITLSSYVTIMLRTTYSDNIKSAEQYASAVVQQKAADVNEEIKQSNMELQNLRDQFLYLSSKGSITRNEVVEVLRQELEKDPHFLGTYTLWEPNAFDGQDALYVNKFGYDKSGRLIPYVVRYGNGSIHVVPLTGYETPGQGDWYLTPKHTKKSLLIDPYTYNVGGQNVLLTSLVIPILNSNHQFLGIVGTDFNLRYLQKTFESIRPLGGSSSLIASNGQYIANGINAKLVTTQSMSKLRWNSILKILKTNRQYETFEGDSLAIYQPVHIEGTDTYWAFRVTIPKRTILASFYHQLTVSIVAVVCALLIAVICTIFALRRALNPVDQVRGVLDEVSRGNLRVTMGENFLNQDEIGKLSMAINHTVTQLREVIKHVGLTTDQVAASSQELTAIAEQATLATEQIANSSLEVATGSRNQASNLEESRKTMSEISYGITQVATRLQSVSESADVAQSSARSGNGAVISAVQQMQTINLNIDSLSEVIQLLEHRSYEIEHIAASISRISSQTNLLALNAAIEAARAGEYGQGFSVVAYEVKKLAEESTEFAAQISQHIFNIQEETQNAVSKMEHSTQEVKKGLLLVSNTGAAFEQIQKASSDVAEQVRDLNTTMKQMSNQVDQIAGVMNSLSDLAAAAAAQAENSSAATEEQLASMQEVTASASSLAKMAGELDATIAKFKI